MNNVLIVAVFMISVLSAGLLPAGNAIKTWHNTKKEPVIVIQKKVVTQPLSPAITVKEVIKARLRGKEVVLHGLPEALTFHEKNQLNKRIRQCAEIAAAVLDPNDLETIDELGKEERHFFYKKEYMTMVLIEYKIINLYLNKAMKATGHHKNSKQYKALKNAIKNKRSVIDELAILFDYYKFVL